MNTGVSFNIRKTPPAAGTNIIPYEYVPGRCIANKINVGHVRSISRIAMPIDIYGALFCPFSPVPDCLIIFFITGNRSNERLGGKREKMSFCTAT